MAIKNLDELLKHILNPQAQDAPEFHKSFNGEIGRFGRINDRAEQHATYDGHDVKLTKNGLTEDALQDSVDRLKDLKSELADYETDAGRRAAQRGIDKEGRTLNKNFDKHIRDLDRAHTSAGRVVEELEKQKTEMVKDLERKFLKEKAKLEKALAAEAPGASRDALAKEISTVKDNFATARETLRDHIDELIEGKKEIQIHVKDITKQLEEATGRSASEVIGKGAAEAKGLTSEVSALAKEGKAGGFGVGKTLVTALGAVIGLDGLRRMFGAESTGTDKAVGAVETAGGAGIIYKAVTAAKAASHARF